MIKERQKGAVKPIIILSHYYGCHHVLLLTMPWDNISWILVNIFGDLNLSSVEILIYI